MISRRRFLPLMPVTLTDWLFPQEPCPAPLAALKLTTLLGPGVAFTGMVEMIAACSSIVGVFRWLHCFCKPRGKVGYPEMWCVLRLIALIPVMAIFCLAQPITYTLIQNLPRDVPGRQPSIVWSVTVQAHVPAYASIPFDINSATPNADAVALGFKPSGSGMLQYVEDDGVWRYFSGSYLTPPDPSVFGNIPPPGGEYPLSSYTPAYTISTLTCKSSNRLGCPFPMATTYEFRGMPVRGWAPDILIVSDAADSTPTIDAITDGVGFNADGVARGGIVTIWGHNLAADDFAAQTVPLPMNLGETSVSIGGISAPLYFVSPGQINAQVPFEVTESLASVVVQARATMSNARTVPVKDIAPMFFENWDDQMPLIFDSQFQLVSALERGKTYIAYLAGLGQTAPPMPTASGGLLTPPLNELTVPFRLEFGGEPLDLKFAGAAPGLVGVYQVNFHVPESLAHRNEQLIAVTTTSATGSGIAREARAFATISMAQVANVESSEFTVKVTYPTPSTTIYFTPNLSLCGTSLRVTPVQNAKPFRIWVTQSGEAVGEIPSSLDILVDPASKTYRMKRDVPANAGRGWGFDYLLQSTEWGALYKKFRALDLLTAGPNGVPPPMPFPNGQVPISRVEPTAWSALSAMPLGSGHSNSMYDSVSSEGSYAASTLEIGTPSEPVSFGQFAYPYVAGAAVTNCTIYIDGKLQKSATLPWKLVKP